MNTSGIQELKKIIQDTLSSLNVGSSDKVSGTEIDDGFKKVEKAFVLDESKDEAPINLTESSLDEDLKYDMDKELEQEMGGLPTLEEILKQLPSWDEIFSFGEEAVTENQGE